MTLSLSLSLYLPLCCQLRHLSAESTTFLISEPDDISPFPFPSLPPSPLPSHSDPLPSSLFFLRSFSLTLPFRANKEGSAAGCCIIMYYNADPPRDRPPTTEPAPVTFILPRCVARPPSVRVRPPPPSSSSFRRSGRPLLFSSSFSHSFL